MIDEAMGLDILYIGGAGRSGSTLLDIILGNMPGFISLGEVLDFWQHANQDKMRCGCGEMLSDCPIWSEVIKALSDVQGINFQDAVHLKNQLDRTRTLPIRFFLKQLYKKEQQIYRKYLADLYGTLAGIVGTRILVDSSKTPTHLFYLSHLADVRIRVLHLVRDPRAVAYSWKKRVKRDFGVKDENARMDKRVFLNSVIRWMMENRYVHLFGKQAYAYSLMRYEDFTESPFETLKNTLDQLDISHEGIEFLHSPSLHLNPTHSVGGNPMRFREITTIRRDDAWKREMSILTQAWLGLLSLPQLINYNYALVQRPPMTGNIQES